MIPYVACIAGSSGPGSNENTLQIDTGKYITQPNSPADGGGDDNVSYHFCLYPKTGISTGSYIWVEATDSGNERVRIRLKSGNNRGIEVGIAATSGGGISNTVSTADDVLTLDAWNFVTVIISDTSNTCNVYVNGSNVLNTGFGISGISSGAPTLETHIGSSLSGGNNWDGNMCNIAWYRGTWTSADDAEFYNGGDTPSWSDFTGSLQGRIDGFIPLIEGRPSTGNEFNDQSGNGYNATKVGSPVLGPPVAA